MTNGTSFVVTAGPATPTIDSVPSSPICANSFPYSATINWTEDASDEYEYRVEYREEGGSWNASSTGWINNGIGAIASSDIIDITSTGVGDTYEFRLQTRDKNNNSCISSYSAIKSFVLILKPDKVTSGMTVIDDPDLDGDVIYNWNAIANTDFCTYEIYMDDSSASTLYKDGIAGTATSYDASSDGKTTLSADTYYWKIRSKRTIDGESCYGDFSSNDDFIVCPSLSLPANLSNHSNSCSPFNTTFSWDSISNADHIWVEFSYDNVNWSGNPTGYNSSDLGSSATDFGIVTFTEALTKTFYWRVRAINDCGSVEKITNGSSFTITAQATATPDGNPADNCGIPYGSTLSWTGGTGTSYTVEISNDGFSSTSWNVTNATGSSTTFTGLGAGTYSWRIKANDACNDGWHTQTGSFTVTAQATATPDGNPADNCGTPYGSTLSWTGGNRNKLYSRNQQ